MRATHGILLGLLVSLAGCGGHQTQTSTAEHSGVVHIARPAKPLWCPENPLGNSQRQRERFDARALLGLTRSQAEAQAAQHGCRSRVVTIDDHPLIVISNYDLRRVDLTLKHDIVTAVDLG